MKTTLIDASISFASPSIEHGNRDPTPQRLERYYRKHGIRTIDKESFMEGLKSAIHHLHRTSGYRDSGFDQKHLHLRSVCCNHNHTLQSAYSEAQCGCLAEALPALNLGTNVAKSIHYFDCQRVRIDFVG